MNLIIEFDNSEMLKNIDEKIVWVTHKLYLVLTGSLLSVC